MLLASTYHYGLLEIWKGTDREMRVQSIKEYLQHVFVELLALQADQKYTSAPSETKVPFNYRVKFLQLFGGKEK